MRFWESSAVVPLLNDEKTSETVRYVLRTDRRIHVWWGTDVECISAIARRERQQAPQTEIVIALERLREYSALWVEVDPTTAVREAAKRFLRAYPLRAADALQLAAAWILSDQNPSSVEFVSLDQRLRDAAAREGFVVMPQRI